MILYYDFDQHLNQYELITSHGVEFKDKKDRFNTFFKYFEEYFNDTSYQPEPKKIKIKPKPFLKG